MRKRLLAFAMAAMMVVPICGYNVGYATELEDDIAIEETTDTVEETTEEAIEEDTTEEITEETTEEITEETTEETTEEVTEDTTEETTELEEEITEENTADTQVEKIDVNEMAYKYSDLFREYTINYLNEVYIEKYPQMALRSKYGTEDDYKALKKLSDNLCEGCVSDTEKAKVISMWIHDKIDPNAKGRKSPFPIDTFIDRKGNCTNAALLMEELCRMQGIPAVITSGYRGDLKETSLLDTNYTKGDGHAWPMVYLNNEWVLFDPQWDIHGDADEEYIRRYFRFDAVEGVTMLAEGLVLEELHTGPDIVYENGKYFCYQDGELSKTGSYQIVKDFYTDYDLGMFCGLLDYCFKINQTHQEIDEINGGSYTINDGWYYIDEPERKAEMVRGQVYTNGLISDSGIAYKEVYENGVSKCNKLEEINGVLYYYDIEGGGRKPLKISADECTIKYGILSIEPGFVGEIKYEYENKYYSRDQLYFDWQVKNRFENDTAIHATVDENGKLTALSNGLIQYGCDVYTLNENGEIDGFLGGGAGCTILISDEERIGDYSDTFVEHSIETPTAINWSDDYKECEIIGPCKYDDKHIIKQKCNVSSEVNPPTCTTDGNITYTATYGTGDATITYSVVEVKSEEKLGHSIKTRVKQELTCTQDGIEEEYCENCDYTNETVTTATGHSIKTRTKQELTCTQDGIEEEYCENCDYSNETISQAQGHKLIKEEVQKPTCTQDGKVVEKCEKCSYKNEIVTPEKGHFLKTDKTEPTCTQNGTEHIYCVNCSYEEKYELKALGHSDKQVIKKATPISDGKITNVCDRCKRESLTKTIYKLSNIALSETIYYYDGKSKKPSVVVKDSKGNIIASNNYSVTYSNNIKPGTATVTVTFDSKEYTGTVKRTFKINPKGTSLTKLVAKSNSKLKISWKKQSKEISGYEIVYSTKKNFTSKKSVMVSKKSTSYTTDSLKAGKTYYVKIRTYKEVEEKGKKVKYYSKWSSVKKIKVK